ncbi:MAG TPA: cation:proton antiporter [Candidatus Nitrosotalea sp.]|nr:cation:proton antiporter [Candidatus Nitrosotalea sp.]
MSQEQRPNPARTQTLWRPPYQVALVVAGIVLGAVPGLPRVHLAPGLLLGLFIPPLVFHAALTQDRAQLRGVIRPVALLAVLGVVLSLAMIGVGAHALVGLGWTSALLLGAVLSPTDPIAVVAVLRRLRPPGRLRALLEGESLFNDAIGAAAFGALLAALGGHAPGPLDLLLTFGRQSLIAVIAGLLLGAAVRLLLSRLGSGLAGLVLLILGAYLAYAIAARAGGSGVMADVVAGLVAGGSRALEPALDALWETPLRGLNSALFLLAGWGLPAALVLGQAVPILALFAVLQVARGLLIPLVVRGQGRWTAPLMVWGGLRGALSIALALAAGSAAGVDPRLPAIGYGVVALSLLLQGLTLGPLWSRLGPRDEAAATSA